MKIGFSYCMAMSVDVDRFTDAYLRKNVLPALSIDGKPVTAAQLRVACFDARNRGLEVLPPCDNVDERGRCAGHAPPPDPGAEAEERWAALFGEASP